MKKIIAVILVIVAAGCAMPMQQNQLEEALALTKEHFFSTASVQDDSLETTARVTTVNGFQEKRGLLGMVWDDNFMRAFVNKKTGATSYQVYQVIVYQAPSWRFYNSVNFETADGPKSVAATIIDRDVSCRASRYSGCTYYEHVAFDVDEELLRKISSAYSPGQRIAWKFRFKSKAGVDHNDGMLLAEVAGFLDRVDSYRSANRLKPNTNSSIANISASQPSVAKKYIVDLPYNQQCVKKCTKDGGSKDFCITDCQANGG